MTTFHFTQPFVITGALIARNGKILLIQENHEPDKGKWNIPAGKLDLGEDPFQAVAREVFEESGLNCAIMIPSNLLPNTWRAPYTRSMWYGILCSRNPDFYEIDQYSENIS